MVHTANTFAAAAQAFRTWAHDGSASEMEAAVSALRAVSALYHAGLHLPDTQDDISEHDPEVPPGPADEEELARAREHFTRIPFQYYDQIYHPHLNPGSPDEPVVGDITDDLMDIYKGISEGLRLYNAGFEADALLQWKLTFRTHWGRHAVAAMHALHCFVMDKDSEFFHTGYLPQ